MPSASKPWWQQATALVSLGAGGAITGFSFVPRPAADLTSPSSMPIHLMALEQSAQQATASDATLRSAIVNVASYYLRLAEAKSPAEMQAIIWQRDSVDGVDHGASCAAFASLTLALGAQAVGQESWVTGGTTYPWPLHKWADVRVNPNPASPGVTSMVQDAQAHERWRQLGDGYAPQPGDWVVFDGHVEVVAEYAGGALHTIGADSAPDYSVNAHEYPNPLGHQGIAGFVDNGSLASTVDRAPLGSGQAADGAQPNDPAGPPPAVIPGPQAAWEAGQTGARSPGGAAIPGAWAPAPGHAKLKQPMQRQARQRRDRIWHGRRPPGGARPGTAVKAGGPWAEVPGQDALPEAAMADTAAIPGLPIMAHRLSASPAAPATAPSTRHHPSRPITSVHDTNGEHTFIGEVAPGAVAAQRRYGVPASVTIAQAILESGWGQSHLAIKDHNLFGIKGTGPAGSDPQPTREYENGQHVTRTNAFRVYRNTAESIDDHGRLLATSAYYRKPMADRRNPDAFAAALTGVYATDPDYGAKLVSLMKRYDLYRYDAASVASAPQTATPRAPAPPEPRPAAPTRPATPTPKETPPAPTPPETTPATPTPAPTAPEPTPTATAPEPTPTATAPEPTPTATPPTPTAPEPTPPAPQAAIIPGLPTAAAAPAASPSAAAPAARAVPGSLGRSGQDQPVPDAVPSTQAVSAERVPARPSPRVRRTPARPARGPVRKYRQPLPPSVSNAFVAKANVPLAQAEPLYRDVADHGGIRWELLAACDWMQCQARARCSPVHGEKLGAVNPDGTSYRTKSAALEQCADDLIELAHAVYGIDVTAPGELSIRDLANVFAAFRWGGLLKLHRTSAMEFPFSVAGLTEQHIKMHWPDIDEPNAPDKPGGRFRLPFGAVPVVLSLNYPATV
jgi:flagellum-specific peptidoglycan hydrolase FlgJ